jgi:hypothetical protein
MARVTVSEYECEHDLLPAVCVKCGEPADDSFVRTVRIIDGGAPWGFWHTLAAIYGLLVFPPLLLWALRRARTVQVKVPVCNADRGKAVREEKLPWVMIPFWIALVFLVDTSIVIDLYTGRPGLLGVGVVTVPLFLASLEALTRRSTKHAGGPADNGVLLSGVHPVFVAALVEDRARDRVANLDRRAASEGVRADFDDEPV